MAEGSGRSVEVNRLGLGRYEADNGRGGTVRFGSGGDDFTPVELLLAAIAGCTAADVDYITVKRAEPTSFAVRAQGAKLRDEGGNRLVDLVVTLDVAFPEGEAGEAARTMLPDAARRSHERLCTVGRTVELGTPISVEVA
ncbi:MAG: OsmC family protein [Pseudonocardia sp.]